MTNSSQKTLKKSPFFDHLNRRHNVDFNEYLSSSIEDEHYINWNQYVLPGDYGDAESEYFAIRNSCAIFDVSPLRKYRIQGVGSGEFLDRLLTRPVTGAPFMRGIYVVFCNNDGSLKDDAILHKYTADDYLLMPSDIDHSAYFDALRQRLGINNVSIVDCTEKLIGIALQGPLSATVLHHMGFEGIEQLEPFEISDYPLPDGSIRIVRMGFTADLGYECWISPGLGNAVAQKIQAVRQLMEIAIPGYGLTALETCRLEGGFIVAGWDCATEADPDPGFERSPFELGLGWLVNLDAADFEGRDALRSQKQSGWKYSLRSFEIDDARKPANRAQLYTRVDGRDTSVGLINCSSWSWGLGRHIGNASIEHPYTGLEEVWTVVESEKLTVKLSRGPLRRFERSRQVPAPIEL
jgi:aminomethyltransferase